MSEETDLCHHIFGNSDNGRFRKELYETTWSRIEEKLKNLQKETFDKVLSQVLEFCDKDHDKDFIPTCSLVTGVNLPDHKDLFKLLSKMLKKSVSDHVACIRSSECSTLKTLVKRMTSQFYSCSSEGSDNEEDDEDDEEVATEGCKRKAKFLHTLSHLKAWYENQHPNAKGRPPLILVLEDFEGFSSQVLCDLVSNIK